MDLYNKCIDYNYCYSYTALTLGKIQKKCLESSPHVLMRDRVIYK